MSPPPPEPASSDFRPAWWCRNPHLQTLWGPLLRRRRLALRRERITTRDADFVDLDWLDGRPGAPVLLVLHGLEGSARSHYVTGLLSEGRARGWRGVALNFRSCSGEPNRQARLYHSGDTADLDAVIAGLLEREPSVRLAAVGVSLGGNVLVKWLGERGADAPRQLAAAVGISVPFDLAACARVLDRGLRRRIYTSSFIRSLRRKVIEKARAYPGFVDLACVRRARTFSQYDRAVTAPLHGFADEVDYWTRSSSGRYLAAVRRPLLLINARDDPFVPREALPDVGGLPRGVVADFPPRGGHAGFLDGPPWRLGSWAERRAIAFLAAHVG